MALAVGLGSCWVITPNLVKSRLSDWSGGLESPVGTEAASCSVSPAGGWGFSHLLELLVDLTRSVAGLYELGGLGEWLADALAGVSDLAAGALSVSVRVCLAFFQAAEPVLQTYDQAGRVGFAKVTDGHFDVGPGSAVEGKGY